MRYSKDYEQMSRQKEVAQKNSYENQMHQKSKQCYKQEQLQDQALIQYYIFEDYQNLINLIFSLQTVIEYFKDDPNNEMVVMCKNKVITQLNISNTIHQDIQETYKDPNYIQLIKKEKQKVKELVSHLPLDIQHSTYLQMYNKNSLSEKVRDSYQKLEQMNRTPKFNNKVVSQIFSSMHLIDQKVSQIQSQKDYTIPSHNDILKKAKQYQNFTKQKLEASFSKKMTQSLIFAPLKQQQNPKEIKRSQSQKNPSKIKSQIEHQFQQQNNDQSNYQKGQQINYLKGCQNLADC